MPGSQPKFLLMTSSIDGLVLGVTGRVCGMHRNYVGAVERAERTPSIVAADKLAKALGTTLSSMFSELERGLDGR
jgi:hypothetical protein